MGTFVIYFFVAFLVIEGQDNVPDIYYSCAPDGLLITASFPKPFHGTIFAKDYYAVPKCSTPNVAAIVTQEVELNLPLLKCGTKVHRRIHLLAETTLAIQYHPILSTVFDYSVNITCRLQERLPNVFWDFYLQREQKPNSKYDSWIEFKLGNKVFGQKESELLGVSDKLFLLVYVKDGGKNKRLLVDTCIVHNDKIVNGETQIAVLSRAERCPADSLSEFSLVTNSSVSDLIAFAEVQPLNISSDGKLYLTCALELCKQTCVQPCQYGMEKSRWSTVITHQIEKRSLEIPDQNLLDSGTKNNLKSSVQALTNKLKRLLQMARRRKKEFRKSTETESAPSTTLNTLEYITGSAVSKLSRQGRIYSLKIDMPIEDSKQINLTGDTSNQTPDLNSNATNCSDTNCMPTVVTDATEDSLDRTQTNAPGTLYSQELLINTSTAGNISINSLNTFKETYINGTEQYSNVALSCVSRLKFISVTASLSFLTVSFFLICVGLFLTLRKERKKHVLDSYLLYNFF